MLAAIAVVRPTSRSLLVSRRSMVSPLNSSARARMDAVTSPLRRSTSGAGPG